MKLEIPELTGKYYSTYAKLTLPDGREVSLDISSSDDFTPSPREEFLREHPEEICDGHYEREATWIVLEALRAHFGGGCRPDTSRRSKHTSV